MVASGIWILLLFIFGFKVFISNKNDFKGFLYAIRKSFAHTLSDGNWVYLVFYLVILLAPLVFGLTIYLKTDANVVVVLFFYVWLYQWIKAVWNSQESTEENPT